MAASVSRLDSGVEKQSESDLLLLIERSINKKLTEAGCEIQTCVKNSHSQGDASATLWWLQEG
jgi:hypothetical protein